MITALSATFKGHRRADHDHQMVYGRRRPAGPARWRPCRAARWRPARLLGVTPVHGGGAYVSAVRRGNLVSQPAGSLRAELDLLRPRTPAGNGPANALDLPVSPGTRRDGPGCRSTGRSVLAAGRAAAR